jgi:hypothetical protein
MEPVKYSYFVFDWVDESIEVVENEGSVKWVWWFVNLDDNPSFFPTLF